MPNLRSESIVLRSYSLSEADRIVVFLTREYGIVRGVAKGAKRLKSRYGSSLEPFTCVDLEFFHKEERELVSIQRADLVGSWFAEASRPEFLQTFSYAADLLLAVAQPHDPNPLLYRMVRSCLEAARNPGTSLEACTLYFEIWLLKLAGYLPDWSRCSKCGSNVDAALGAVVSADFHLACRLCRPSGQTELAPDHIHVFHSVQKLSPAAFSERSLPEHGELREVFRRLITRVIGREPIGDKILAAAP
jgi:DNA repair protein RecO (recombination protein O)